MTFAEFGIFVCKSLENEKNMPRRKITAVAALDDVAADLPELTAQQMAFVRGLIAGLSASDAYRQAYHTENSKENTIWANASRLKNDNNVQAWLAAARKAELSDAVWTHERMIRRLDGAAQRCAESGNLGAEFQNNWGIAQLAGLVVHKHEDVTRQPSKIVDDLARLIGREQAQAVLDTMAGNAAKTIEHVAAPSEPDKM